MKVQAEIYRGIEFVRISNLPNEERERIFQTLDSSKIIKILRDKELLNDCVQVTDYNEWSRLNITSDQDKAVVASEKKEVPQVLKTESLKFALK